MVRIFIKAMAIVMIKAIPTGSASDTILQN